MSLPDLSEASLRGSTLGFLPTRVPIHRRKSSQTDYWALSNPDTSLGRLPRSHRQWPQLKRVKGSSKWCRHCVAMMLHPGCQQEGTWLWGLQQDPVVAQC